MPPFLRYVACKRRRCVPAKVTRISEIMEHVADSIPRARDCKEPALSIDVETKALRTEVGRLVTGLYGGVMTGSHSRLHELLSAFAAGIDS